MADFYAQRAQLAVQMSTLHIHPLGEQPDLAIAQHQLLLQIRTLELLARFAQRQSQQVVLDQRLIGRRLRRQLALDFFEPDLLGDDVKEAEGLPQLGDLVLGQAARLYRGDRHVVDL